MLTKIDLSDPAFWAQSPRRRAEDFAVLRAQLHPMFFREPEPLLGGTPGPGYYALVTYRDVVEASKNQEVFSAARGAGAIADNPDAGGCSSSMMNMDDPRHAKLRRLVSQAYTPRMLENLKTGMRQTAAQIVTDLIDRGPCDFAADVAVGLPLRVICEMSGVGPQDYDMMLANVAVLGHNDPEWTGHNGAEVAAQVTAANVRIGTLGLELAALRAKEPADDIISALVTANVDGEALTDAEVASFFALLAGGGIETGRIALAHALILLTEFPEQRKLLLDDFDGRIRGAVDEIIRWSAPVVFTRRTLTRDYVLNGHQLREGDKVVLYYGSASRDEKVFADPERFDITRHPNPHVGFGGPGTHYCIGAYLAKLELAIMLGELLRRIPDIRAVGEPDYLLSYHLNGIKHLRCEF